MLPPEYLFCLLLLIHSGYCRYTADTLSYLEQFNYLPKQTGASAILSATVVEDALKKLQRYGRIPVTGKLDSETIKLMARKRCGLGDQQPRKHRRHKKRFALGSIWHKSFLTYSPAIAAIAISKAIATAPTTSAATVTVTPTPTPTPPATPKLTATATHHHQQHQQREQQHQ